MALNLWSATRRSPGKSVGSDGPEQVEGGHRHPHEQDYDRILFSSPVRRLSDKTQVFPLDANDSIRTRLTHSHEVANLARSIGLRAWTEKPDIFGEKINFQRVVAPLLAASGLAHDLGNPPFGHQGEAAISAWFDHRKDWIFDRKSKSGGDVDAVDSSTRDEFLKFDGNPQSIRLLTRLQTSKGEVGLDLTAAAILACMKYPVAADGMDRNHPAKKKYGYFCSEKDTVDWARSETGLKEGQRHPLTWITEAADDTAYSVLDVEDSMRKGILSPDDLLTILRTQDGAKDSPVVAKLGTKFEETDNLDRTPSIRRDIKIGYARALLIEELVTHATAKFLESRTAIWNFDLDEALMDSSPLCTSLKEVARQYAFGNSEVLYVEARGRKAIEGLLDAFWLSLVERKNDEIDSTRKTARSRYIHSLISPNYIEAALKGKNGNTGSDHLRYRELRLLTDMISGMTDQFSINLHEKIATLQ